MSDLLKKYIKGQSAPNPAAIKALPGLFGAQPPPKNLRAAQPVNANAPNVKTSLKVPGTFNKHRQGTPHASFGSDPDGFFMFNPFLREWYIEFKGKTRI